jgi:hypothetical protein
LSENQVIFLNIDKILAVSRKIRKIKGQRKPRTIVSAEDPDESTDPDNFK